MTRQWPIPLSKPAAYHPTPNSHGSQVNAARFLFSLARCQAIQKWWRWNTYTGVLIGSTAVPVWNENVGTLPHHFAASGVNSAVSILELMGQENKALNNLGIVASAYEVYEGIALETRRTRANEPVHKGRSGFIVRTGGTLSGPVPLALRIAFAITGKKVFRQAAAWSSLAGSLLTRFGWIDAGHASSKDHRIPLMLEESAPVVRKSSHEVIVNKSS